MYGVGLGGDPTGLALEYFDAVEAMDIELEGVLTEFSPGQLEINLTYGPALAAADEAVLVKEMTREVAARRGYRATYMGRPACDVGRLGPARQLLGGAGVRRGQRLRRRRSTPDGLSDARPPEHRRADRPPRGRRRAVGAAGQQLQAADARADRRVLGQLGPRQPVQHVPRPGRAGVGDAHREPGAVRVGEPVPRRRGDAERRAARRRRRARLRRSRSSATPTQHRTPIGTRRTRWPRRSTRSRPTPC